VLDIDPCELLTDDEVAAAVGALSLNAAPSGSGGCEKGDGAARTVVITLQQPGMSADAGFDYMRDKGAEQLGELDVDALYDSSVELVRMRTPGAITCWCSSSSAGEAPVRRS
jgi:hypothetical protein